VNRVTNGRPTKPAHLGFYVEGLFTETQTKA